MRPIPPAPAPGQRILLIPAMLDAHFPLLQYAFHSRDYYPVILSQSRGLADLGLRYAHNDLCYPFVLSLGQYLQALGSGAYDLDQVSLLMPSAGDACRGSNFPSWFPRDFVPVQFADKMELLFPQIVYFVWKQIYVIAQNGYIFFINHNRNIEIISTIINSVQFSISV